MPFQYDGFYTKLAYKHPIKAYSDVKWETFSCNIGIKIQAYMASYDFKRVTLKIIHPKSGLPIYDSVYSQAEKISDKLLTMKKSVKIAKMPFDICIYYYVRIDQGNGIYVEIEDIQEYIKY